MVTPSARLPQSSISAPSVSPPDATERSPGSVASAALSILSAVGGRNTDVTPQSATSLRAPSTSNRGNRAATTGTPKARPGIATSSSPPIHAQSAGVHSTSRSGVSRSWLISTPGRWPVRTRWACSAPLGAPVVPEV